MAVLVLSRKTGEKILVGDGITISVVEVRGNRVRLGIEAPAHVAIFREELAPGEPAAHRAPSIGRHASAGG
jgi:carbon storage regulator